MLTRRVFLFLGLPGRPRMDVTPVVRLRDNGRLRSQVYGGDVIVEVAGSTIVSGIVVTDGGELRLRAAKGAGIATVTIDRCELHEAGERERRD